VNHVNTSGVSASKNSKLHPLDSGFSQVCHRRDNMAIDRSRDDAVLWQSGLDCDDASNTSDNRLQ